MAILALGEILIDFVPQQRGVGLDSVEDFKKRFGGAPANAAVGLGRLEEDVYFLGQVGKDAFGLFLRETLENNGVKTDFFEMTGEAPTTLAFVSLEESGERDFIFYRQPGADALLSKNVLNEKVFDATRVLLTGSVSLSSGPAAETTEKALVEAKKRDIITCFDVNYRHFLWPGEKIFADKIHSLLEHIDVLKMNLEELVLLNEREGEADLEDGLLSDQAAEVEKAADTLLKNGPELVVITSGSEGCFYKTGKAGGYVAVDSEVEALDTTGAGDAFMAVLVSFINDRADDFPEGLTEEFLQEIMTFANRAGALTVEEYGAIRGLPSRRQLFSQE